MSTILFPSPVFGPVRSRRLGVSLGVNLMPADGKVCTFNCIYCECGLNGTHIPTQKRPAQQEVYQMLRAKLADMKLNGQLPDVITFAGNGEPTSHPRFAAIIRDTLALRDQYCLKAKVSVLTNGTNLHRREVFDALRLVDNNIVKLDAVLPQMVRQINQPAIWYTPEEQIRYLSAFRGKVTIQTLFLRGTVNGQDITNIKEENIRPWLSALLDIMPGHVMLYTIDRETPISTLSKASSRELDAIAARVRKLGFHVSVSY